MQKLLKLQHHRHSGKLLHHKHTSYRAIAVVFVAAGAVMLGLTAVNRAAADELGVTAFANVPVPTQAPLIIAPSDGATLSSGTTLVYGSCPLVTPQAVVAISVDGELAGTSACDGNNDFSVPVSLSAGSHHLIATSENVAGVTGASTKPLQLTAPATAAPNTALITTHTPFMFMDSDKTITWSGAIGTVGAGSEHIHIDWGDGSQVNYSVDSGAQHFSHHYATLASYNVLLVASNTAGETSRTQYAVAAFTTAAAYSNTKSAAALYGTKTTLGLYGLYLTAASAMCIVWLEAKHAARHFAHEHAML